MSPRASLCLIVLAALSFLAPVPAAHALTLNVKRDAVVAGDVTRGGNAVFFAVVFDNASSIPGWKRTATILRDDDGDGVVSLAMPDGVPPLGTWAVVDMSSGAAQLGSMRGYNIMPFEDAVETSFRSDARGQFVKLEREMNDAAMLVVRPGQGAWTLRGTEGGETDEDTELNGKLVLPFSELVPITPEHTPPGALLPGDVVVLIEVGRARAFAGVLPQAR